MENHYIVLIQKQIRGFLVRNKLLIPNSYYHTKQWRKNQLWYKNGKYNECEIYQKNIIKKLYNINIKSTNERIDSEQYLICLVKNIFKNNDAFKYTEDFDGKYEFNNNIYYFNLKFVCGQGGVQNRTMREVYHFINYQIQHIKQKIIDRLINKIYFINILDGDQFYLHFDKFKYLMDKDPEIAKFIFIGDMYTFQLKYKFI